MPSPVRAWSWTMRSGWGSDPGQHLSRGSRVSVRGLRRICLRAGLRRAGRAGHGFPCAEQLLVEVPQGADRPMGRPPGRGHVKSPSSVLGAAYGYRAGGLCRAEPPLGPGTETDSASATLPAGRAAIARLVSWALTRGHLACASRPHRPWRARTCSGRSAAVACQGQAP
jgi:hypothetical protein